MSEQPENRVTEKVGQGRNILDLLQDDMVRGPSDFFRKCVEQREAEDARIAKIRAEEKLNAGEPTAVASAPEPLWTMPPFADAVDMFKHGLAAQSADTSEDEDEDEEEEEEDEESETSNIDESADDRDVIDIAALKQQQGESTVTEAARNMFAEGVSPQAEPKPTVRATVAAQTGSVKKEKFSALAFFKKVGGALIDFMKRAAEIAVMKFALEVGNMIVQSVLDIARRRTGRPMDITTSMGPSAYAPQAYAHAHAHATSETGQSTLPFAQKPRLVHPTEQRTEAATAGAAQNTSRSWGMDVFNKLV